MSLALIRTAITTAVRAMAGVDECYPRIPETKPTVNGSGATIDLFAVVETPSGVVAAYGSDLERREHLINVYFLTRRNGDLWAEQVTVEPFIDAFPNAMAAAFTLGGLTYGTRYTDPAWEMVIAEIDDQAYIGPRFGTLHKEKSSISYSG